MKNLLEHDWLVTRHDSNCPSNGKKAVVALKSILRLTTRTINEK